MRILQLGSHKQDITPPHPITLAGFAHRKGKANKTFESLYLRSFLLKNNNSSFLFIVADLIWWDTRFVKKMKSKIEKEFEISGKQIVIHATHNHSGPQTSSSFSKQLGELDTSYLSFLEEKLMFSIKKLFLDLQEVEMVVHSGTSQVGINRRKKLDNIIKMAPNTDGEVDDELKIYSFLNDSGQKKAMWLHYTCHPTSTDENVISSEFTGVCCKKLEETFPGCNVAYLQGYCGDIRPKLISNEEFYRGDIKDMVHLGNELFNDVMRLFKNSTAKACRFVPFVFREKEIPLTFDNENITKIIPGKLKEEWPKLVDNNRNRSYTLIFQYVKISDLFEMVACNAELVNFYGSYIKDHNKNVIPLGYSNGMVGYIPTAKQLDEGGYEAEESIFYFGYPNKVNREMENQIKDEMKKLIRGDV